MKARVDSAKCVGHGRCYELAPEVFGDDERGHCVLLIADVPPELERRALSAEGNCPEGAIEIGIGIDPDQTLSSRTRPPPLRR